MCVRCPTCGVSCRELGKGTFEGKSGQVYKYIYSQCEQHGEFTTNVRESAFVVMTVTKNGKEHRLR